MIYFVRCQEAQRNNDLEVLHNNELKASCFLDVKKITNRL